METSEHAEILEAWLLAFLMPVARRHVPLALTAIILAGWAHIAAAQIGDPGETVPPPQPADPIFRWSTDVQAYAYGAQTGRTDDSVINPGNTTARLANVTLTGEVRPNVKATSAHLDLVLEPRLSSVFEAGGVPDNESVRGYIHQGFLRAKFDDTISIIAGRELMAWGPAIFRSPSNPYYFNNQRLDPIVELSGIDEVRASAALGPYWTLSVGIILDSGHNLVANDAYRQSLMLKADYVRNDYLGSLIIASLRGGSAFIGGFGQKTIGSDALLYGEFGSSSSRTGLDIAAPGHLALFTPTASNHRAVTALAGGSYTFPNGQSLYLEYLYNGFGYTGGELDAYFAQLHQANVQRVLGGRLAGLGGASIGDAALRAQDLLGQHYLYAQYQNNPAQGDNLWRLMFSHDLVDHSTELGFYIEHSLTSRISLLALGIYNIGSRDTDYGSTFRYSLTAGAKIFLY